MSRNSKRTFYIGFLAGAQNFKCPPKDGQYEDPVQCDMYYECVDGQAVQKLCPDGLVFDPTIRKINKCDQPFNVDCGDRTELRMIYFSIFHWNALILREFSELQNHQRATTYVPGKMDSSLILIQQSAMFSTTAQMGNTQKSPAQLACTLTSTLELACGLIPLNVKDAKTRAVSYSSTFYHLFALKISSINFFQRNSRTVSSAPRIRQLTPQAKLLPIPNMPIPQTARDSTSASMVQNLVILAAKLVKSTMRRHSAVTPLKMCQDAKTGTPRQTRRRIK